MKQSHLAKTLAILLALALCLSALAGCAASTTDTSASDTASQTQESEDVSNPTVNETSTESTEPVTITLWIDNTTDAREAIYNQLIEQYEAENPNINVELLGVSGDMTEKLDIALAAGSPPDCSTLVQGSVSSYVLNGELLSLDSYLADWDCYDQVLSSAWETVESFNAIDDQMCAPVRQQRLVPVGQHNDV